MSDQPRKFLFIVMSGGRPDISFYWDDPPKYDRDRREWNGLRVLMLRELKGHEYRWGLLDAQRWYYEHHFLKDQRKLKGAA